MASEITVPWFLIGPAGSGKLRQARSWIEAAYKTPLTFETRTFTVADDYTVYVTASPHHFEIDIPTLSMQDKQIMGELLTTFFNAGDVLNSMKLGGRKLVILRRAHALSLPAAIRVRAILQQYVLPANGTGMIWITAREVSGPLAILEDVFLRKRIPRMPYSTWTSTVDSRFHTEEAYEALEGRTERATKMVTYGITSFPRRISDYYDELIQAMLEAGKKPSTLHTIKWIRARVYDVLAFCQNGPEIIDSMAAALARNAKRMDPVQCWEGMKRLSESEPHTSYRTPLALESAFLEVYDVLTSSKPPTLVGSHGSHVESVATELPKASVSVQSVTTSVAKRGTGSSKHSKS